MITPLVVDPSERPIPPSVGAPHRLWIDGEGVEASSGESEETIDPTTEQPLTTIPIASQTDVDAAVSAARRAFEHASWRGLDPADRERILLQVAEVLEHNAEELAILDSLEMGGGLALTRWMVDHTVKVFRNFAGWPSKLYGQTAPSEASQLQYALRQPLGVVACIAGWNGPMLQMGYKVAPALATGNTVVVKPSEQSSLSMLRFAELLATTDLPPGVLNVVTGSGRTVGEKLISHPDVAKISFTGSTAVGKHVLQTSASTLKHVTLELGGKSPFLIFADADLAEAARTCALAFCANSGQACVAGTRIYVEESIRGQFLALLLDEIQAFARGLGDPFHPDTRMGPMAFRGHFEEVNAYVETARRDGTLITGEEQVEGVGLFMPPALVTDLEETSPVLTQEIFGPIAALSTFGSEDEAVTLANDTIYGLAASVWTRDVGRALRASRDIDAGTVWVNRGSQQSYGPLPFGGYKQSGLGREHGTQVLDAYTQVKSVVVQLS